ncbi:MAG: hypothetical protein FD123_4183 [Bacteroidetes bacterium]|nr:MAG: hypothetical protein FD123_4183 [Bacteroidota bacterium]
MNNIEKYFAGEKLQCTIGIILSFISIALSVYFLALHKPLLRGISFVFIPLSVLLLIICIGVVTRTPKDIERITGFYKTEPQKIQTDELPRMEKVMKNFTLIKRIELCFFTAGLLLTIFFGKNDLIKGIAIGLMIQGAILYLFDYSAEVRGKVYFEFLKSL